MKLFATILTAAAALALPAAPALAQTKLKWAHVYEVSEPYHTESVWAAEEIKKRTNGKFDIQVFPASSLGKETDINQGMTLGTVDMIISGPSFAARSFPRIGVAYYPFIFRDAAHQAAYAKSPVFRELAAEYQKKTGIVMTAYTYYGRAAHHFEPGVHRLRRHEGPEDPGARRAAVHGHAEVLRRQPDPDRVRRGLPRAAERHGRGPGDPLTTIEAKKFYEVQKHIMLTGHIVDGLVTQIAPHVWSKLNDAEKKIFTDVTQEAAARATAKIVKREAELVDEFRKKGLNIVQVNRQSFVDAVLKNVTPESMGYDRKDYDRIVALK